MTRVAAIADVHLGNHRLHAGTRRAGLNDRARAVLAVLDGAVQRANADAVDMLVVAGDLFDTSRPPPAHIAAVQAILASLPGRCHVLCGNHDQTSDGHGDNAVAPLGPVAGVHEQPRVVWPCVFVPFRNAPAAEYIRAALDGLGGRAGLAGAEVLVIHAGVEDERTSHFLRGAHDSIHVDQLFGLLSDYGLTCALTGNWHHQQVWRRDGMEIAQVGALVPTGHDNPGLRGYGGYVTWDSSRPLGQCVEVVQLPGPRFVSCPSAEQLAMAVSEWEPGRVYGRIQCRADAVEAERTAAEQLGLAGLSVVPSGAAARAQVAEAIAAAQAGETRAEQLAAWVRAHPWSGGVTAEAVEAEVADLLTVA